MQEECYVLVHCNSSSAQSAQQQQFVPILHPALRKLKEPQDEQSKCTSPTVNLYNTHPPSLLRSNSAPGGQTEHIRNHSEHQDRLSTLEYHRMNSSSGGDKENQPASLNSRPNHAHHYPHHNQHQQNHHHNSHVFRNAQADRFTYPGFSTAGSTYNTYWTHPHGNGGPRNVPEARLSVHIPALDLTAITLDDSENDNNSSSNNKILKAFEEKGTSSQPNNNCNSTNKGNAMAEEKNGNKKHKSPFVFPREKSLADFDGMRTNPPHAVYEDPASTGPFVQIGRSFANEDMPNPEHNKQQPQPKPQHNQTHIQKNLKQQEPQQGRATVDAKDNQKVIHFSLVNPKLGKYILDDECPPSPTSESPRNLKEPQRTRESLAESAKMSENSACLTSPQNQGFVRRASDTSHNTQEIIDVVVVDGHLHVDLDDKENHEEESDSVVPDLNLENATPEPSKEKPKPRVTFSFDHEIQSCRSLKRYTPVKMDIKPLQGVLKKRPEPTQVLDAGANDCLEGSKQTYFNDSNAVFRKSSKPEAPDQGGIRVKHLHTTNFDISREAGKRGTSIPSTMQIAEKPPIPVSRRVALAAAENAAMGLNNNRNSNNNNNLLFTGGLTYICSNAKGRVAYFRPSDVTSRSGDTANSNNNNIKVKSRSTEDINGGDAGRFFSTTSTYNGQARSAANRKAGNRGPAMSSPYTLRRSVSTDHGFAAPGSRGGGVEVGGTKPVKPRVAFGSFIVPKETTPRVKKAQVKYQEVETVARPALGNGGTYIHSHTRRTSPYSAPTQVLYDRSSSTSGPTGFRRPYTAQVSKATHAQHTGGARGYNKDSASLAQRHSAPSSFSSVKDRAWRASVARQRISIDSSPSQGDAGALDRPSPASSGGAVGPCGNGFLLPSKMRPQHASSGIQVQQGKSNGTVQSSSGKLNHGAERLAVRTLSRPDLSALNMLANRDKGVSQTRFLATLSKTQNKES